MEKILRYPLPDQVKALLEKIDASDGDLCTSSLERVQSLLSRAGLSLYERWMIRRNFRKYQRAKAMAVCMEIVMGRPASVELSRYDVFRQTLQNKEFQNLMTGQFTP